MIGQWMRMPSHNNTPAPVAGPPPARASDDVPYLTTDALLSYCQTRLRGLDEQVDKVFKQQQKANDDSAILGGLQTCLSAYQNGFDPKGSAVHELIRYFQRAINDVGSDTTLGKKLFEQQQSFISKVGTNGGADLRAEMSQGDYWTKAVSPTADQGTVANGISPDDVKAMITTMKDLQTDVNHGSEMGMITLQSLMSQRQMAIQIVTNMVQSLGDMTNKVAANIGR